MSEILDMEARIKDYVSANVDKINSKLDSMGNAAKASTTKASGGFSAMGLSIDKLVTAAAGLMIFRKVSEYISNATDAASIQIKADAQLAAVLQSTKEAAGVTAKEMKALSQQLQGVTTYGDEVIERGTAMILTFTKVGKEVIPDAIETMLNMSTAMRTDVQQSAIQLGKALNEPIEGVAALRRVGVQLNDQQEDQIKTFVEMGDLVSAQKIIIGELKTEFGGLARAMAETDVGKLDISKNLLSDMSEKLGNDLIPLMREWKELQLSIANIAIPAGSAILKGINAEIQMFKGASRDLLQTNETLKIAQQDSDEEGINRLTTHIEKLKSKYKEQQSAVEESQKYLDSMPGGAGLISRTLAEKNLAEAEDKFAEYEELLYKSQTTLEKMMGMGGPVAPPKPTEPTITELTEEQLQDKIDQLQEQIKYEEEVKKEIEEIEKELQSGAGTMFGVSGNIQEIGTPDKDNLKERLDYDKQYHEAKLALQQAEIMSKEDAHVQELALLKLQQGEELRIYEEGSDARALTEQRHIVELANLKKKQSKEDADQDKQTTQSKMQSAKSVSNMTIGTIQNVTRAMKMGSEVQKALDIGQATANVYLGVTKALASPTTQWQIPWILSYGLSQVAVIASQKYAQSGIVQGNNTTGDRQIAGVNAREMILNTQDQAAMFDLIKRPNSVDNSSVALNINLSGGGSYDMSAARFTVEQLTPIIGEALIRAKNEGRLRTYEGAR
jgi:hypothetical protein